MDDYPKSKQSSYKLFFNLELRLVELTIGVLSKQGGPPGQQFALFPHLFQSQLLLHPFCSLHLFSPVTNNQKHGCPYSYVLTGIAYIYYFPY